MFNRVIEIYPSHAKISQYYLTISIFILGLSASFFSQAVISRVVTPVEFGKFSVIYGWSTVISAVAALGFDVSVLRFVPAALIEKNQGEADEFTRFALHLVFFASCIIGISAIFTSLLLEFLPTYTSAIFGFIVATWGLTRFLAGNMRAHELTNLSLFADRVLRDGCLLMVGVAAITLAWKVNLNHVLNSLAIGCALGASLGILKLNSKRRVNKFVGVQVKPIWIGTSLSLLTMNSLELFSARMDIFATAHFMGLEFSGSVNILLTIANLITIPGAFFTILALPKISVYSKLKNRVKLKEIMVNLTIANLLFSSVILLILLVLNEYVLSIYSFEITNNITVVSYITMLISRIVSQIGLFCALLLMMNGKEKIIISTNLTIIMLKLLSYLLFNYNISIDIISFVILISMLIPTAINILYGIGIYRSMASHL